MEAIKVFLCGGANSGKTVFLSSLYKSLSVADSHLGLRCETSATARALLSTIFNHLAVKWPLGTELDEQHELPFSFYLDNQQRDSFLATKVTFYDYSGGAVVLSGSLTHEVAARMEEIKALADTCHVVMAVLDGNLVYESLYNNDNQAIPELESVIDAILAIWNNSVTRKIDGRQNHYFVVTKWDRFEDSDETLCQVRDMILEIPTIQSYIGRLDEESVIRIIPVSAVGKGFAEPIAGTREMKIVAKRPLPPINVDIPIACLLPDLVNAEIARSLKELEKAAHREALRKISWWKRLAKFVGDAIDRSPTLRRLINDFGINQHEIERISTALKDPMLKSEQERDMKIAQLAAQANSTNEAAAIVHNHFETIRGRFESKYPSSLVRG